MVTDAEDQRGLFWTVQCEVIQQHLLGAQPGDEDPALDNAPQDGMQPPFNFFGFGQVGVGPVEEEAAEEN